MHLIHKIPFRSSVAITLYNPFCRDKQHIPSSKSLASYLLFLFLILIPILSISSSVHSLIHSTNVLTPNRQTPLSLSRPLLQQPVPPLT